VLGPGNRTDWPCPCYCGMSSPSSRLKAWVPASALLRFLRPQPGLQLAFPRLDCKASLVVPLQAGMVFLSLCASPHLH
jgi:hypothetical protein